MSSDHAIEVTGLSKAYRVAREKVQPTTLAEALANRIKSPLGTQESEVFWALRDVNLTVRRGEVVGIIGRNGAGKSTLLKILSRVTEPTSGEARVWGRVGSLLEVGTGFHPELTGRENVFLNGAILGMRRDEIARRFDEIAAFADVQRFLDMPVKRYSSGMYVRLAFAVAAHLDTEILLVDEVLAVGDMAFQEKCLGRMEATAQSGRTILFVSHNLGAIGQLCQKAVYLHEGKVLYSGEAKAVVAQYVAEQSSPRVSRAINVAAATDAPVRVSSCWVEGDDGTCRDAFAASDGVTVCLRLACMQAREGLEVSVRLHNSLLQPLFTASLSQSLGRLATVAVGETVLSFSIPAGFLAPDSYSLSIAVHRPNMEMLDLLEHAVRFRVQETGTDMYGYPGHSGTSYGNILTRFDWAYRSIP